MNIFNVNFTYKIPTLLLQNAHLTSRFSLWESYPCQGEARLKCIMLPHIKTDIHRLFSDFILFYFDERVTSFCLYLLHDPKINPVRGKKEKYKNPSYSPSDQHHTYIHVKAMLKDSSKKKEKNKTLK